MTMIIPQDIQIERFDNGEIVNVPDITLMMWDQALTFETSPKNTSGMMMTRISASACAKRMLGLPRGWSKKRVLVVIRDLRAQLKAAQAA